MARGRLIAFRNDRLGARLLSLVNAWRLAQDHDVPMAMRWPQTSGVGAEFNDPHAFFDRAFVDTHFIGASEWQRIRGQAVKLNGPSQMTGAELRAAIGRGRSFTVELAFGAVVLADEDPAAVGERCAALFRALPLAPRLAALAGRVGDALGSATAYHIRRGDLIGDIRAKNRSWPKKYVPTEFYLQHLAQEAGAARQLVLFSDDAALIETLRVRHPECRVLSDLVSYEGLSQGEIDFLELFALAECAKIIAPEGSAFSTTAAQLGEVPRLGVKEDLGAKGRAAACETLRARLAAEVPTPETAGELAQALLHVEMQLLEEGRREELAALYCRQIGAGLDISFVYPRAVELLLAEGRLEDAVAVARPASGAQPYHDKDLIALRLREAAAMARLGRTDAARRALQIVLWHAPLAAELSRVLPRLLILGGLGGDGFLPCSPEVLGLAGRAQSVAKLKAPGLEHLARLLPGDRREAEVRRGATEPLLWDWEVLLSAEKMVARSLTGDIAVRLLESIRAQEARGNPGAGFAGTRGIVLAHKGETGRAIALLAQLAQAAPGDPLAWQRLSHAHWLARDRAPAAETALRAASLSDAPAYRAWAGLCLEKAGRAEEARDHLLAAYRADTGFATIPGGLARVAARCGDLELALEAIDAAVVLAPNNPRFEATRAELLRDAGDHEAAIAVLDGLIRRARMPMTGYRTLCDLLVEAGRPRTAREVVNIGLRHKPDDPHLTRRLGELGEAPKAETLP